MSDKKKENKTYTYIEWIDPHSVDEWTLIEDLKKQKTCRIVTVGRIIFEDKERIAVTLNYNKENEDASCTMILPKRVIVERRDFELSGKRTNGVVRVNKD